MADISKLEAALESLKLSDSINYTKTAQEFSVDQNTLSRRHRGVQASRATKSQNKQSLSPQQESELIKYIEKLSSQGLPPTHEMIRNFASEIAENYIRKN